MLGTYALSSGYYEAYYGRAQRVRTKIAEDFSRAFERFDFVVTPDLAHGRLQARREDRRPAGDVPVRLLHGADAAGRDPGDLDPRRARRSPTAAVPSCRSASRSPVRPSASSAMLDAALRARAGDRLPPERLTEERLDGPDRLRGGDRARDPRPALDRDEDVLRLRALLRRRAQRPHLPGLPRPSGVPADDQRAGDPLRADDRGGARVRGGAPVDLPPQELLLSRPARRATRSASTTYRSPSTAGSATSASIAPTSRRTPRSSSTSASRGGSTAPAPRWSTSTAAARRWSRSSPSPTSAPRRRPASGRSCCGRRSASSASPT